MTDARHSTVPAETDRVQLEVLNNRADSAFSPFARKVRMVLDYKGLGFQSIDGLLNTA